MSEEILKLLQNQNKKIDAISEKFDVKFSEQNGKIDAISEKFDVKFSEQDGKIDALTEQMEFLVGVVLNNTKKLEEHDAKFESVDKRFDGMGKRFDVMSSIVLDNRDRLDRIEKKLDTLPTTEKIDDILKMGDNLLKKFIAREQEDIMKTHGITRVEEKVYKNTSDIRQIKPLVGLA